MQSPEVRLRLLAREDPTLQSYLLGDNGIWRWYDRQLAQGAFKLGPCVRVLRVSTVRMYCMDGILAVSQPRFQIDVLDLDPEQCRTIRNAVIDFLGTVDLNSPDQFNSIPTTPPQFPNFVINQRSGMDFQLDPPAYVESIDVRMYVVEN